jgi:hypothetical protein
MDEKIVDDKVRELRLQVQVLRARVNGLEAVLFRGVVALGSAALVLGFRAVPVGDREGG